LWRVYNGAPVGLAVEDWRAAAAYLATHAAPDDLLLFLPAGHVLPFARAYAGQGPPLTMRGVPIDLAEAPDTIEPAVRPQHLPVLAQLPTGRQQFWLVTVTPDQGPHLNIPLALEFYANHATLRERVDLTGIVLYRYTR
jgi:hypothetical protein